MSKKQDEAAAFVRLLQRSIRMVNVASGDDPLAELTLSQKRIVRSVYESPSTVSSLAEEMNLTVSAVTQNVKKLLDQGILEHGEQEEDRRQKPLRLTAYGEAMMRERSERQQIRARQILKKFSPEEQDQILKALRLLVNTAGAPPAAAAPEMILDEIQHAGSVR